MVMNKYQNVQRDVQHAVLLPVIQYGHSDPSLVAATNRMKLSPPEIDDLSLSARLTRL